MEVVEVENCCIFLGKLSPCDAHNNNTQNPKSALISPLRLRKFCVISSSEGSRKKSLGEVLEYWQKISTISWHFDNSTLPTIFVAIKLTSMKISFVSWREYLLLLPSICDCMIDFLADRSRASLFFPWDLCRVRAHAKSHSTRAAFRFCTQYNTLNAAKIYIWLRVASAIHRCNTFRQEENPLINYLSRISE